MELEETMKAQSKSFKIKENQMLQNLQTWSVKFIRQKYLQIGSTSKPSRQIGIASNIAWLQFSDITTSYLAHCLSALPWTEKQAILGKNAMGE